MYLVHVPVLEGLRTIFESTTIVRLRLVVYEAYLGFVVRIGKEKKWKENWKLFLNSFLSSKKLPIQYTGTIDRTSYTVLLFSPDFKIIFFRYRGLIVHWIAYR